MSTWELANASLKHLRPYEPGKPVDDVARELGLDPQNILKLASNENPLGPSPKALKAIQSAAKEIHLYPDGGAFHLRNALAEHHGLHQTQVVLGSGSNEVIELMFHAFAQSSGMNVVASQHAFIVYKLIAQLFGVPFIEASSPDFHHHLDILAQSINDQTRMIFLTNANNPTGTRIPNDELKEFIFRLPENIIIGLDEAYYEFLDDPPPSTSWLNERPNLVLLRTFSKIHGLAGLRIGYGLCHPETAEILQRCRQPFNVNAPAQAAALAALDDKVHQQKTLEINRNGKRQLEAFLQEENIEFIPSHANFVMIRVGNGQEIFQKLMKKGIIVRPLAGGYHLPEWIRVSIGTPKQMERFLREFKLLELIHK